MNVYEAIEASPIGVAWHEVGKQTICKHESCRWSDKNFPDGWQPLYTSPAEYTLGEPLTQDEWDKLDDESRIIYKTAYGQVRQGMRKNLAFVYGTRYADPRPLPVLPEVKEQVALFYEDDLQDGTYKLTDEGRRRLEGLLRDYVPLSEYIGG